MNLEPYDLVFIGDEWFFLLAASLEPLDCASFLSRERMVPRVVSSSSMDSSIMARFLAGPWFESESMFIGSSVVPDRGFYRDIFEI